MVHVERAGGVSWVAQLRFGARREALDGERRRRDQDKVHHALVKSLRFFLYRLEMYDEIFEKGILLI